MIYESAAKVRRECGESAAHPGTPVSLFQHHNVSYHHLVLLIIALRKRLSSKYVIYGDKSNTRFPDILPTYILHLFCQKSFKKSVQYSFKKMSKNMPKNLPEYMSKSLSKRTVKNLFKKSVKKSF